jgi:hypothetical protein
MDEHRHACQLSCSEGTSHYLNDEEHSAKYTDGHHCIYHGTISCIFPIFRSRWKWREVDI